MAIATTNLACGPKAHTPTTSPRCPLCHTEVSFKENGFVKPDDPDTIASNAMSSNHAEGDVFLQAWIENGKKPFNGGIGRLYVSHEFCSSCDPEVGKKVLSMARALGLDGVQTYVLTGSGAGKPVGNVYRVN